MSFIKKAKSVGSKVASTTTKVICGTFYTVGFLTCKASVGIESAVVTRTDDLSAREVKNNRHKQTVDGYNKVVDALESGYGFVANLGKTESGDEVPAFATGNPLE